MTLADRVEGLDGLPWLITKITSWRSVTFSGYTVAVAGPPVPDPDAIQVPDYIVADCGETDTGDTEFLLVYDGSGEQPSKATVSRDILAALRAQEAEGRGR